ncbi:MAG: hypothetical protein ACOYBL_06810 [Lachnospiraceae bacterium]
MPTSPKGIRLIVTIVEQGQGKPITHLYTRHQVSCHFQSSGKGTASSDLLDILGFGGTDRDIVISLAPSDTADMLMHNLADNPKELSAVKGIAFDMNLTGINNMLASAMLSEQNKPKSIHTGTGGHLMISTEKNSLILVAVNQGNTEEVMNTARAAGARGGTIIRSRWAGETASEHFYGFTVQDEKEIIAIVASSENRNAIMEMINMKHGLKTDAGAIICSVALEHLIRLR